MTTTTMTTTTTGESSVATTKVDPEAAGISPDLLATLLSSASSFGSSSASPAASTTESSPSSTSHILVVDCRPFMAFNQAHVVGALNAHCPTILKRRSGGFVALENIVPCPDQRQRLLSGGYRAVVVYDQSTTALASARADSNLYAVVKSLLQQVPQMDGRVFFLVGGYDAFSEDCPVLCATPQFSVLANGRYDVLTAATADDQPVEIATHLLLGSGQHAKNLELLQRLGVSALVNVSTTCPNQYPQHFRYLHIPVRDTSSEDLLSWFHTTNSFIDEVRAEGGRVLVHCQAGRSRSATVCLAYLMRTMHLSLDSAFEHVRSRREVIDPNLNFMRQLQDYRRQLDSAVNQQGRGGQEDEQMCLECDRLSPAVTSLSSPLVTSRACSPFAAGSPFSFQEPFVASSSVPLDPSHGTHFHSHFSPSMSPLPPFMSPLPSPMSSLPLPVSPFPLSSPPSPSLFTFPEVRPSASSPSLFAFPEVRPSASSPGTPREAPAPFSLSSAPSQTSASSPAPHSAFPPPPSPATAPDVHCFFAFPEPFQLKAFRYPFSSEDLLADHVACASVTTSSAFTSLAAQDLNLHLPARARTPDLAHSVPGSSQPGLCL